MITSPIELATKLRMRVPFSNTLLTPDLWVSLAELNDPRTRPLYCTEPIEVMDKLRQRNVHRGDISI